MVFDPMHFLPLLEQKVGALDQAAPLKGWDRGVEFATLHRLLEARMGKAGKREYVQVLRLMENFEMGDVHGAVRPALNMGAIGYDAVKHLLLCPHSKATAKAGPGYLSRPAQGQCRDNKARSLYESPGGGGRPMSAAPERLLHHHLKKLRRADLPLRL